MPDTPKRVEAHIYFPKEENEALSQYISDRYNGCPPPRTQVIRHLIAIGIIQERKKMEAKSVSH